MAFPSVTYSFANATTADATQVNQNFTDLINSLSDGTKSLNISAITTGGAITSNANTILGSSSSNTVTFNAVVTSTGIPISGSGAFTTTLSAGASTASYTFRLPLAAPTVTSVLNMDSSGNVSAGLFAASQVVCDTGGGHGSTNTKIRIFANHTTTGSDITYATNATNGDSFTINTAGIYIISYTDKNIGGVGTLGVSVNSAQLTTNIDSITVANRLGYTSNPSGTAGSFTVAYRAAVNDVIRAHDDGTMNSVAAGLAQFSIVRVA